MYTVFYISGSLLLIGLCLAQPPPLSSYNVDPDSLSVSGFSSGASFALQMHVAHSATIKRAAIYSGFPYFCAGWYMKCTVCNKTLSRN